MKLRRRRTPVENSLCKPVGWHRIDLCQDLAVGRPLAVNIAILRAKIDRGSRGMASASLCSSHTQAVADNTPPSQWSFINSPNR